MSKRMEEVWGMQKFVESNFDSAGLLRVEELLLMWGQDQVGYRLVDGYARVDSSCQDHTSSMQYLDTTEVVEARSRVYLVQQVEACVRGLPYQEELVLRAVYANAIGATAWSVGPLRDKSREELKALHLRAVRTLLPMLRRRGVGLD